MAWKNRREKEILNYTKTQNHARNHETPTSRTRTSYFTKIKKTA